MTESQLTIGEVYDYAAVWVDGILAARNRQSDRLRRMHSEYHRRIKRRRSK